RLRSGGIVPLPEIDDEHGRVMRRGTLRRAREVLNLVDVVALMIAGIAVPARGHANLERGVVDPRRPAVRETLRPRLRRRGCAVTRYERGHATLGSLKPNVVGAVHVEALEVDSIGDRVRLRERSGGDVERDRIGPVEIAVAGKDRSVLRGVF